jgi:hypothetical protein
MSSRHWETATLRIRTPAVNNKWRSVLVGPGVCIYEMGVYNTEHLKCQKDLLSKQRFFRPYARWEVGLF